MATYSVQKKSLVKNSIPSDIPRSNNDEESPGSRGGDSASFYSALMSAREESSSPSLIDDDSESLVENNFVNSLDKIKGYSLVETEMLSLDSISASATSDTSEDEISNFADNPIEAILKLEDAMEGGDSAHIDAILEASLALRIYQILYNSHNKCSTSRFKIRSENFIQSKLMGVDKAAYEQWIRLQTIKTLEHVIQCPSDYKRFLKQCSNPMGFVHSSIPWILHGSRILVHLIKGASMGAGIFTANYILQDS